MNKLKQLNFYRPQSALSLHTESIETYFRTHPPASIKEARDKIQELTGITRSPTQVRQFLTSLGMRPRKVGMMPAKGDAQKQDTFKKRFGAKNEASPQQAAGYHREDHFL